MPKIPQIKKSFNRLKVLTILLLFLPILNIGMVSTTTVNADPWTTRTSMPTPRDRLAAAAVDGKIYAIGGKGTQSPYHVSTVEMFNPIDGTWVTKSSMPTARSALAAAVVNGKIYTIGGFNGYNAIATVEEYNPTTNSWRSRENMPTARSGLVAVEVNGKIYAICGVGEEEMITVEEYDPSTNSWRSRADMPTARQGVAAAVVNGKIYVISGSNRGSKNTVEEYNPATNTWTTKAPIPTPRYHLAAAAVGGKIYAIGGAWPISSIVEEYNPTTDTWTTKTPMLTPREGLAAAAVGGKIYAIGGGDQGSNVYSAVEEYNPSLEPPPEFSDLVVTDISWSPISPNGGETVTVTVIVKNQGSITVSSSSVVKYYIDGQFLNSDTVGMLTPGASTTETFTLIAESGCHTIKAVADANNQVAESNEANNERTGELCGSLPADLVITDFSWGPSNPKEGDAVTFTIYIRNQGSGSADASVVKYYLDGSYQDEDSVGVLAPGASTTETFMWTAERDCHSIKAVVDANNQVAESNEANNECTEQLCPNATTEAPPPETPKPDLVITSIEWNPFNPTADEIVTFNIYLKNQGAGEAGPSTVKYYLDDRYYDDDSVDTLAPGSSVTMAFTWTATDGCHLIMAEVDATNRVSETNEANNKHREELCTKKTSPSSEVKTSGPDLVITEISWTPDPPIEGESVTFTIILTNRGTSTASTCIVKYYLDDKLVADDSIQNINPGQSISTSFNWTPEPGCKTIRAEVDANSDVDEINEDNNYLEEDICPKTEQPIFFPGFEITFGLVGLVVLSLCRIILRNRNESKHKKE